MKNDENALKKYKIYYFSDKRNEIKIFITNAENIKQAVEFLLNKEEKEIVILEVEPIK